MAPTNIVVADICNIDWSHADIVYINCVTWDNILLTHVVDKASRLKNGSTLIAFALLPERAFL